MLLAAGVELVCVGGVVIDRLETGAAGDDETSDLTSGLPD